MSGPASLHVEGHFDPDTWTVSYIVLDRTTKQCALLDSVLDYDPRARRHPWHRRAHHGMQEVFGSLFNAGSDFARDGRQFDHLFADGEAFSIGTLRARAMHTRPT